MSGYEIIMQLPPEVIDTLIIKGLMRATVKRDKEIYEHYLRQCRTQASRMQARTNTAEQFSISEDRVSKIIQKMR
ncbi:MAG: hypothetical protein P4L28_11935 [Paludibacteraceae bacterium]|nr:hypothetical protein [Paludibacteraceae bacterium]